MSGQAPPENMPSQPPKQEAYAKHTLRNPVTRNLSEFAVADTPGTAGSEGTCSDYMSYHPDGTRTTRTPFDGQNIGQPSALGRGVRGGKPTSERERQGTHYAAEGEAPEQNDNEDAEAQMETYGEGKVADAVERTRRRNASGSPHGRARGEVSLDGEEADLERKKAQQQVARQQVKDARQRGEDVDGLGAEQTGERKPAVEV